LTFEFHGIISRLYTVFKTYFRMWVYCWDLLHLACIWHCWWHNFKIVCWHAYYFSEIGCNLSLSCFPALPLFSLLYVEPVVYLFCGYSAVFCLDVCDEHSSSSLFLQIKIHDAKRAHDKTWTGQQGGKNHTYCCPWIEKEKKQTQNLHNTLQLNTMEKNITVIKTTMGVLAKDQVAWKVNLIKWISETV